MNKTTVWLIIAALLLIVGLVIFALEMTALGWDFSKLGTVKFVTVTHEIDRGFRGVSIDTDTADIVIVPADDGVCRVVCYEREKVTHAVMVEDDVLTVRVADQSLWDHIGISFHTPKITVYLPEKEYETLVIRESTGDVDVARGFTFGKLVAELSTGDVTLRADVKEQARIKTTTGDILVENAAAQGFDLCATTGDITVKSVSCAGNMDLSATTGRVSVTASECGGNVDVGIGTGKTELTDLSCGSITTVGTTGDIRMKNVIAKESVSIERGTGDVTFDACDAAEISVRTTTGDVTGSLLSPKIFEADATTGDVRVPSSDEGGTCVINTTTGDIHITIK